MKAASNRIGSAGMVVATHAARYRCASSDSKCLSESRWHSGSPCREAKPASGKTGHFSDHRVNGRTRFAQHRQQPQHRKPSCAKPAIPGTTGFGVEFSGLEPETRTPKASACEPFREAIDRGPSCGRNAMAIWQHLVAENGFCGSYETVKRFVHKLRGAQPARARAVICTPPGEEAQVDYGSGITLR
jgi:hypothetical protein